MRLVNYELAGLKLVEQVYGYVVTAWEQIPESQVYLFGGLSTGEVRYGAMKYEDRKWVILYEGSVK